MHGVTRRGSKGRSTRGWGSRGEKQGAPGKRVQEEAHLETLHEKEAYWTTKEKNVSRSRRETKGRRERERETWSKGSRAQAFNSQPQKPRRGLKPISLIKIGGTPALQQRSAKICQWMPLKPRFVLDIRARGEPK